MNCILCHHPTGASGLIQGPLKRDYYCCPNCELIFVNPSQRPSISEERQEYERHENSPLSPGYVTFLSRAMEPALAFLSPGASGLDYGSGPGPVLSGLLEARGFFCDNYDPLFGPDLKQRDYDFVFSTECFEHFHHPVKELDRIDGLLRPSGFLIVMTLLRSPETHFASWYYARENTHVLFYTRATFEYIAQKWNYKWLWDDRERVIIFQKRAHLPE